MDGFICFAIKSVPDFPFHPSAERHRDTQNSADSSHASDLRPSACIIGSLLSGCGSAINIVTAPAEAAYKSASPDVSKGTSTVQVSDEFAAYFDGKLRTEVHKSFITGKTLRLEYRFISFDAGSRFNRCMSGGIGDRGQGTL